ncbi:FeMo cofactor biosynthesis protein NifB [bioreactor metagenome]|uniref:FeMo cofactor biosynthesis protein NifB n=1 Tax=bioreactor metagenome TaxID=1076179 RepID=A0A644UFE7_9ZZZZ|nr:nitrogenase cofactor biosynthesis protein NifB [Methanocorpusculum sp.]
MESRETDQDLRDAQNLPYDPDTLRRINEHPCYSPEARHTFGRCHVAVAPKCNIQCNYCVRDYDCVNESRPGVTSKVLIPGEALERIDEVVDRMKHIRVVGIAGPGDPLANEETFETLRLVHEKYPDVILCLSTNGLLLPEKIDILEKYGVRNITVTLNAIDAAIGEKIYSFVEYQGKKYHGREAADILLRQQLKGIEEAVKRKMLVKINTVYIPGVNDEHIPEIAKKVGAMGVFNFNIIPLIPQYKFKDVVPPTAADKAKMHERCAPYVRQMRHCQRCRADAVGLLGKDVQNEFGCCGKGDGSGKGCSGE